MTSKSFGTLPQTLALSALLAIGALVLPVQAVAQDTVYDFSGSCNDCQNTGNGVLTLQNYTPGTTLSADNFVSFTYSSNLLTFNVTQSELDFNTLGIANTSPFVSGPTTTDVGLSGALGSTAGSADFYLNASITEGSSAYSINFDSCSTSSAVCGSGLTSPGEWQILTAAVGNSSLPGGLGTKISDYGFSHAWTPVSVVAAPEMDAGSATGAVALLIAVLAVMGGRRSRPLEKIT
jgi:hypothetical protein